MSSHVAGCVEFPLLPLHRLRLGRRTRQRISGTGATACGFWVAARGRSAKNFRRGAVPGVCCSLHHHAQHLARRKDRTPPLRIRDDGDGAGRILEPDVRHVFPDDAARRRIAGLKLSVLIVLNGFRPASSAGQASLVNTLRAVPESSRTGEINKVWRSTNYTGRRPHSPRTATILSPILPR